MYIHVIYMYMLAPHVYVLSCVSLLPVCCVHPPDVPCTCVHVYMYMYAMSTDYLTSDLQILELWLTYIQPWRYTDPQKPSSENKESLEAIPRKWCASLLDVIWKGGGYSPTCASPLSLINNCVYGCKKQA